jgi:hypothetical protein
MWLTVPTSTPWYFTGSPRVSPLTDSSKWILNSTSSRWLPPDSQTKKSTAASTRPMTNKPSTK